MGERASHWMSVSVEVRWEEGGTVAGEGEFVDPSGQRARGQLRGTCP